MAKGKAIDLEANIDALSEITFKDIPSAQAWATPELQSLLVAPSEDEINANPEG